MEKGRTERDDVFGRRKKRKRITYELGIDSLNLVEHLNSHLYLASVVRSARLIWSK